MEDPVAVPIGFWLRTVDALFESSMDDMLATHDATRRLWQALSTVKRNEPVSTVDVEGAMARFLDDSKGPLLEDLAGRGWAEERQGMWSLTDQGRSVFAALEQQVMAHREVMFHGVDDQAYRTTVETLARIASNLDPQGVRAAPFR